MRAFTRVMLVFVGVSTASVPISCALSDDMSDEADAGGGTWRSDVGGPDEDDIVRVPPPVDRETSRCATAAFDLFSAPNPYFDNNNELFDEIHIGVGHAVRIAAAHTDANRSGSRSRVEVTEVELVDETIASTEPWNTTDFVLVGGRPGVTEMTVRSCSVSRTLRVRVHDAERWEVSVAVVMQTARSPSTAEGPTPIGVAALDTSRPRDVVIGDDVVVEVGILPLSRYGEPLRGSLRDGAPMLDRLRGYSSDVDPDHMVFTLDTFGAGDTLEVPLGPGANPPALRLEVVGFEDVRSLRQEVGIPPHEAPRQVELLLDTTLPDGDAARYLDLFANYAVWWRAPPLRAVFIDDRGRSIVGFQSQLTWSVSSRRITQRDSDVPRFDAVVVALEGFFDEPDLAGVLDGVTVPRIVVEPDRAYQVVWSDGSREVAMTFLTRLLEAP